MAGLAIDLLDMAWVSAVRCCFLTCSFAAWLAHTKEAIRGGEAQSGVDVCEEDEA